MYKSFRVQIPVADGKYTRLALDTHTAYLQNLLLQLGCILALSCALEGSEPDSSLMREGSLADSTAASSACSLCSHSFSWWGASNKALQRMHWAWLALHKTVVAW